MKIILYSDLHLEFGTDFMPPIDLDADIMILAGDICILKNFEPLAKFLANWTKPVLYIAGNHEYYTKRPMQEGKDRARTIADNGLTNITFLDDESVTIDGVNFFGGTMWTDFNKQDPIDMHTAQFSMNDYQLIKKGSSKLKPLDTVYFHKDYKKKLIEWFNAPLDGARVVISHHAPCINPNGYHKGSGLEAAYNSLDMVSVMEEFKPSLWVYGHTHEKDDQVIGETRVVSNPRGYPLRSGGCECKDFDENGVGIVI